MPKVLSLEPNTNSGVCFWEASGLQNRQAGFDSLHSCCRWQSGCPVCGTRRLVLGNGNHHGRLSLKHITYSYHVLGVCWIRTRLCEGRRPGSTPGKDTYLSRNALPREYIRRRCPMARRLSAKQLRVGSIPTGVSYSCLVSAARPQRSLPSIPRRQTDKMRDSHELNLFPSMCGIHESNCSYSW